MKTFKDSTGRGWEISLTLGSAMKVKSKLGVDLLQPEDGDPPLLTRLGTDEMLLAEIICCLLENQFEKHGVDAENIYEAFDGETLLASQKAFYEELVDFFRSRGRADRAKAVAKQTALINLAVAQAEQKIDAVDIENLISGAMSGKSQEPSESILID
jgi:hypothetical protein